MRINKGDKVRHIYNGRTGVVTIAPKYASTMKRQWGDAVDCCHTACLIWDDTQQRGACEAAKLEVVR